ncbi:DNA lyase [Plectosphaerella plurivora]|uniref:DNA-(apurinic or apyrimidinic site) endonuclease 2 n=1 Tax=Plectosphaerella plurivora TaxID=936078 RepID=A0A9P8VFJ4_9PEZI|nr:DNA lyase [Plectosphaerella plurivora]
MFDILEADIVVMQETKIQRKDLKDDMVLVPGWDVHFSLPKHKKGYSGVAIYTRNSTCCPIRAEEGITGALCPPNSSTKFCNLPEAQQIGGYPRVGQLPGEVDEATLDSEGRCVILEFPAFVLIGTYSPANRDTSRDEFRVGYLNALDVRVRNLVAAGKQVILTGDLNVSRSVLDTCNLTEALRKEDMTVEDWMAAPSRRLFNQLIFEGEVVGERDEGREVPVMWDICRCFHPDREGMFTCWDTKRNTRPANNGARIDYVLCSAGLKDWVIDSNIQEGLMGSDHCPVYVTFGDLVDRGGEKVHLLDLMNPEGMVRDGKRIRDWAQKDLLPMSARLIPEFDRRRNIRDMFMKKPATKQPTASMTDSPDTTETSTPNTPLDSTSQTPRPLLQESALKLPSESSMTTPVALPSDTTLSKAKPLSSAKRPADKPSSPKRTLKKSRTSESQVSKTNGGKSQTSLASFFKPKTPREEPAAPKPATSPPKPTPESPARPIVATASSSQAEPSSQPLSALDAAEKVFDPVETKELWSKFQLGLRQAPKCEHGEPCISLQTKKPGVNCGRSFYICPRPLGPTGDKEKGTQWRCATFIWSSDWKKGQT